MKPNTNSCTSSYGINVSSMMENMLADELSKSINNEILLDIISPETKGMDSTDRWRAVRRNQKIDSITGDNTGFNSNI